MRIAAFMIVRDEADIVELALRHHRPLVDAFAVIDHGSTDGTSEILAALAAEGWPLAITTDPDPPFRQKAMLDALIGRVRASDPFDWALVVDADEFLVVPDRAAFEALLTSLPRDRAAVIEWPTHVPSFDEGVPLASRLARTRRVVDPGHAMGKLLLPRAVLERPGVSVSLGQHALETKGGACAPDAGARVPPELCTLAHVPIRSREQFIWKFVTGWLSRVASTGARPTSSVQGRDAFDAIVSGEPVDDAMMTAFAVNYGIPRAQWRAVVSDNLVEAAPFLRGEPARYDALARPRGPGSLLELVERLVAARRR